MAQETKNFDAGADITAFSIVKPGADDKHVVLAAAATDKLLGVTTIVPSKAGEPADVTYRGVAPVKLAGPVALGDFITANGAGLGIKAAPGVGAHVRTIGTALEDGAAGDIVDIDVQPGAITNPAV